MSHWLLLLHVLSAHVKSWLLVEILLATERLLLLLVHVHWHLGLECLIHGLLLLHTKAIVHHVRLSHRLLHSGLKRLLRSLHRLLHACYALTLTSLALRL